MTQYDGRRNVRGAARDPHHDATAGELECLGLQFDLGHQSTPLTAWVLSPMPSSRYSLSPTAPFTPVVGCGTRFWVESSGSRSKSGDSTASWSLPRRGGQSFHTAAATT